MTGHRYEFEYGEQTAFANAAALLQRGFGPGDMVLDIGCGFGALSTKCREAGYDYVGIDLEPAGVKRLNDAGFEAHELLIEATEEFRAGLEKIIGQRSVAGLLMLDVIEHVPDPVGVLDLLRGIATAHDAAPIILTVPNVSHFDVGTKLLQGHWDQTEIGILDDTHVNFFDVRQLARTTQAAGWHEVDSLDFRLERSDQHFPADNVALVSGTPLNSLLHEVRNGTDPFGDVVQFVRTFVPGPRSGKRVSRGFDDTAPEAPFLSILTRTMGDRLETLQETLLCLTGQSCMDFEVLVLAHNVTPEVAQSLEYLIASMPPSAAGHFRVVPVTGPGRCRPLNVGVEQARGRYISVLDDDDLVLGNWVEEFRDLAQQRPGRVLRAVVGEQDIARGPWPDRMGYQLESGVSTPYPAAFDLFDHLVENRSPPCGLAFPRSCFRDLGISFDESLPVLEDWDVLLQCVLVCGIAASPVLTSIYRRWQKGASSTSIHSSAEWFGAHQAVIAKLDRRASVVPSGSITRVRELQRELLEQRDSSNRQQATIDDLRLQLNHVSLEGNHYRVLSDRLAEEFRQLEDQFHGSASWRLTRPIRVVSGKLRKLRP